MSESQLRAALAASEARNAQLEQQLTSKIKISHSDAGYVQITGLPGISWKGLSLLPMTWKKLPEQMKAVLDYCDRNSALLESLNKAYQLNKKQATG